MKKIFLILFFVLIALAISHAAGSGEEGEYPTKPMEFIAPGGAGGGWDLTIRTVDKVLHDTELISFPTPVVNKPGGGGGVTLAYLQQNKDADNIVSVYSPPLLLINLNGSSEYSYKDLTPLARLIADYAAFIVLNDSPFRNINDLIQAMEQDVKAVKVGGVSSVGSMDHLKFLVLAQKAGMSNLKDIDYISFQDGSALTQLLGGHVDVYAGDLGDVVGLVESGDVRILGITSPSRVDRFPDVQTVKEQGIDMEFINWRGLFGPKNMSDVAVKFWQDKFRHMVATPEWAAASKNNGWEMIYLNGPEFETYLDQVNEDYKTVLDSVGLLAQ